MIFRRKPIHNYSSQQQPPQGPSSSVGAAAACVEVGKFGLDEELERLKRDKNVLMQEVVRLRQQQHSTDHQVLALMQRIQGMEQRQQQMMSFLAKAMHSPAFLSNFLHQSDDGNGNQRIQGDNNRCIEDDVNRVAAKKKKHRLRTETATSATHGGPIPNNGQIIRYRSANESTKTLLMEILNTTSSSRSPSSPDESLSVGSVHVPAMKAFENDYPPILSSLNPADVKPTVGFDYAPSASGYPEVVVPSSASIPTMAAHHNLPDPCVLTSALPVSVASGKTPLRISRFPSEPAPVPEHTDANLASRIYESNQIAADVSIPLKADKLSVVGTNGLFAGTHDVMPDVCEFTWDQLILGTPIPSEMDDLESSPHDVLGKGNIFSPAARETEWDAANMEQLTVQMGLLAPGING